jgi:hypothetical protein
MSHRPNYYQILKLDPSVTQWDLIERRINELNQRYSKVRTDSNKSVQREAEAFKIYLESMRKVMCDPVQVSEESRQRRLQLEEEKTLLKSMLRLLRTRGETYSAEDVQIILGRLNAFDEATVKDELHKLGLKENTGKKPISKSTTKPKLTDSEMSTIDTDLKGLGLDSLYTFLGNNLDRKSSQGALKDAIDQQKNVISRLVSGTPEKNVRTALLGHAQHILLNISSREKYDNTLEDRGLKRVESLIRLAGGNDKQITEETLTAIIKEVSALREVGSFGSYAIPSMTASDMRVHIESWVNERKGWLWRVGLRPECDRLLSCGFCGTLSANTSQKCCLKCGESLQQPCPNPKCKTIVATENKCCPDCGYTTGDAPRVKQMLTQANAFVKQRQWEKASVIIDGVLKLWPDYAGAVTMVTAMAKIRDDLKNRHNKLLELVRDHKLREASRLMDELVCDGQTIVPNVQKQIVVGLKSAEALYQECGDLVKLSQNEQAVDKLQQALALCCDMSEAVEALSKLPPSAPSDLTVRRTTTSIKLEWNCSCFRPLMRFVVLRKKDRRPNSPSDGERLGTVQGLTFDDSNVKVGEVWYYAVYSQWQEQYSREPCYSKAVLVPGSLSDLSSVAIDGHVRLTWKLPWKCQAVEIERLSDNKVFHSIGQEFTDDGFAAGSTLSYEVTPLYADPERPGKTVRGAACRTTVRMSKRPLPVNDLTGVVHGSQVHVRWTKPMVGRVELRYDESCSRPDSTGMLIDSAKAAQIGPAVSPLGDQSAVLTLPISGQIHLIPVSVEGSNAILGKSLFISNLPEVAGFKVRLLSDNNVKLIWDWPDGVKEVRLTVEAIVSGSAITEATSLITKDEFLAQRSTWQVRCAQQAIYRFIVATRSSTGDHYSKGVSCTESFGLGAQVRYEVVNNKLLRIQPRMVVRVHSGNITELNDVVVAGLPTRVPTELQGATIISEQTRVVFQNGQAEIPLNCQGLTQPLFARLFLINPTPGIQLLSAAQDRLLVKI